MKMKQIAKTTFIVATFSMTLHGCFVAGAAAGAAAVSAVYDHRKIEATLEDNKIATKISDQIRYQAKASDDNHIDVTVFNHVVLLTGQTTSAAWRNDVEAIAKSVPSVKRVYNQISIQGPSSSLTRTSDAWITTKIKTQMLATTDLKSSDIKVVTEDGSVYLMGTVSKTQAEIAVDIARQVSGVQRVVKVFQYR